MPGKSWITRKLAAATTGAGLLLTGGVLAAVTGGGTASAAPTAAADCGVMFDDFAYTSHTDPAFGRNGWTARSNSGGPGVPGASWKAENITFPTVSGQKVAQLQSSTDGTAAGTVQSEFLTTERKFKNGTYAARVRFSDAPVSGPDGDHVNQTFFAIGPAQRHTFDPDYSELDFSEYLPTAAGASRARSTTRPAGTATRTNRGWPTTHTTSSAPASPAGTTWLPPRPAST